MDTRKELTSFNEGNFFLYDSNAMPYQQYNPFSHFALTDALITAAGEDSQPVLHFWQTEPLIILGMMDTKTGNFEDGLHVFDTYKHDYIIRNSGGLAVVSDPGVLNVSLIYPVGDSGLSINNGYEFMLSFVRQTFYPYFKQTIDAYEIRESYCFGDYDLSIDGRKIAGISQRRIKKGVAIMMYLSVNGDQLARAQMLKDFYTVALDGTEPPERYPNIKPTVMTTLTDAYQTHITVDEVKKMMLEHFSWSNGDFTSQLDHSFKEALEKMYKRNSRFFGNEFIHKF